MSDQQPCSVCAGKFVVKFKGGLWICDHCHGAGKEPQPSSVEPPATTDQEFIRLIARATLADMRRTGESHEMCSRWLSERINAALATERQQHQQERETLTRLANILENDGIIEIAVHNKSGSVSDYINHWEGRALKAEAALTHVEAERDTLKAQHAASLAESNSIIEWMIAAAEGQPVSEFAESFPPVLTMLDIRASLAAQQTENERLTKEQDTMRNALAQIQNHVDCKQWYSAPCKACGVNPSISAEGDTSPYVCLDCLIGAALASRPHTQEPTT